MEILLAHIHISGSPSVTGIALLLLILCGIVILAKAIFRQGTRIVGFIGGLAGALLLGYLIFGFIPGTHTSPRRSHLQSFHHRVGQTGRRVELEARAIERRVEQIARQAELNAQSVELKAEQLARQAEKLDSEGINYEEALNKLNKLRIRLVQGSDESTHQPAATNELKIDADIASDGDAGLTRPAWVDKPSTRVGNVQRRVVKVGPWESVAECHRELGTPALKIVNEYVQQEFTQLEVAPSEGIGLGLSTADLRKMGIDEAFVLHEICTDEFVETTEHDFGGEDREMHTLHVLMEFSPSVHKALQHRLLDYRRQQKATMVSLIAGGVIGVLGLFYGLLKVDTWTKGYYAKRLWIGVPVAVISALTAIALFVV